MRSVQLIFIILSTLLSVEAFSRVDKSPFKISIKGKRGLTEGLKKRAELKMARSTAYCRGFYMPKRTAKWACKATAPGVNTCQTVYRCKPTTKKFNRNSEVRRLKKEIRKIRITKDPLKIKVGRKPYKKLRTKKLMKKLVQAKSLPRPKPRPTPVPTPAPNIAPPESPDVSNSDLDELAQFNESDDVANAMVKSTVDEDLTEGLDDDFEDELEELSENVDKKTEKMASEENKEEGSDEGEDEEDSSDGPYESHPAKLAAFSFDLIQVADDFDSIVTIGASWTPRKDFNTKVGMRGQFGAKSLKIFSGTTLEETFLVYELGLYMYLNFNPRIYAEVGYVLQKWNDTEGSSESAFGVGLGYKFDQKIMKVFDRLFLNYSTVSNQTNNRELKFSAGISF